MPKDGACRVVWCANTVAPTQPVVSDLIRYPCVKRFNQLKVLYPLGYKIRVFFHSYDWAYP
jgi:hypothetical protein